MLTVAAAQPELQLAGVEDLLCEGHDRKRHVGKGEGGQT